MGRVDMFRLQHGVAVELTQRLYDVPSLNGELLLLQREGQGGSGVLRLCMVATETVFKRLWADCSGWLL